MSASAPLRVAVFSGNYNYVRDGANQALNRLVDYLLRQGVAVRVYSPTTDTPAFAPAGDLVSAPSIPFPQARAEYRFSTGMNERVRDDLRRFAPDIVHVSAPDLLGHRAVSWAKARGLPVLATMHTRFETYFQYYGLGFVVPVIEAILRRFYRRADKVLAPSASMADLMREKGQGHEIGIWARGIDTTIFTPARRSTAWRKTLGLADKEVVIGFLGRLVMEKGLDVFVRAIRALEGRGVPHRVLVIGDGPARDWFAAELPNAVFAGFQSGPDLGRAVASMDIFFNPSVTETFGNVTLEAMACGIPVVAARATGSSNLVADGETGALITPGDAAGFADVLAAYCHDPARREAHGQAGLLASRAYDWDAVNAVVLEAYLHLVAGGALKR
jgi:glycosyltransferase involved in cell wall biosynthesis